MIDNFWPHILSVVPLGLIAGMLGGMLGVGGSVIIIPGLVFIFGQKNPDMGQHLYQAAAMIVNVAVSIPAARRHYRAGVTNFQAIRWILPPTLFFVLVGVWLSNQPVFAGASGSRLLGRILASFLVYVIFNNIRKLIASPKSSGIADLPTKPMSPARYGFVGMAMGSIAGLLGIGGGAIAVPLQQVVLKLPLRSCIANSSTIICVSAGVGAIYKNATLGMHHYQWTTSLLVAAMLAPSAWLGGRWGATLTHRLPLRQVRIAFIVLMCVAAWKMSAIS